MFLFSKAFEGRIGGVERQVKSEKAKLSPFFNPFPFTFLLFVLLPPGPLSQVTCFR
jgi:hypothetical protein